MPLHAPSSTTSADLSDQVQRETVRHTVRQAFKTQTTTPLGWLLVLGLVATRAPVGPALAWIGMFSVMLVFILVVLWRLRTRPVAIDRKIVWLRVVAAVDGLGWGSLTFFVFGVDVILDSWLVTVLCGVAAANAPARALLPTTYGTQLVAMWLPIAAFGVQATHVQGSLQMVVGVALFMALLLVYVRSVERVMSNNILLRLQNTDLSAQLQRSLSHVEREASTDPLTEQANRREMNRVLVEVDRRRRSDGVTYSLLMLDIDHFKQINHRAAARRDADRSHCGRAAHLRNRRRAAAAERPAAARHGLDRRGRAAGAADADRGGQVVRRGRLRGEAHRPQPGQRRPCALTAPPDRRAWIRPPQPPPGPRWPRRNGRSS